MMRDIGELKHRISIEQKISKTDPSTGYPANVWEERFKLWAYMEDATGSEFFESGAVQMVQTTNFTIRWRNGLANDMRVVYKNRIYEIISISGGRNIGDLMIIKTREQRKEVKDVRN